MYSPIYQQVQVNFTYPVCFTSRLFSPENLLLRDTLCKTLLETSPKVLCVIDDGVVKYHPDLLDSINVYFQTHQQYLNLICEPQSVPGGEQAKNNAGNLASIHEAIHK